MATFFSDFFEIDEEIVEGYGAFNISLVNDLPLFIDPFLLFNSEKQEYVALHNDIIEYLLFLRERALVGPVHEGDLKRLYCFPEIKQNWLGFSISGNKGSGLGLKFAIDLHKNLHKVLKNFGKEKITEGTHLEKLCLISEGVGRDNISDFTTNLILGFLCRYTEQFAKAHLKPSQLKYVAINKVRFSTRTQSWDRARFWLPWINNDYVIITPKDMLTRDDNWINRNDLIEGIESIPLAIPDEQLRAQVSSYFYKVLVQPPDREPSKKERTEAALETLLQFPELLDYYILMKEQNGDEAEDESSKKVLQTERLFIRQLKLVQQALIKDTPYYATQKNTYEEAHERLAYLKDVIESKGGHRIFYQEGEPIEREKDVQILFRLVWFGSPSDVGTEANDGRGPVDFKISRGAPDKTLIEMKLAKNTQLERNLRKQLPIYQAASDAERAIKAIVYFTVGEQQRVEGILDKLGLLGHRDIVLIDARNDNKPSGSKA